MVGRIVLTILSIVVLLSSTEGYGILAEESTRLPKWISTGLGHQPSNTGGGLESEDYFPDLTDEEEDFEDLKVLRGTPGVHEETLVIQEDESRCLTIPTRIGEYHYLLLSSNKLRQLTVKCTFSSVSGEVFFQERKVASFDSSSMYSEVPLTYRWTSYSSSALMIVKRKKDGGEITCNVQSIKKNQCDCGNAGKTELNTNHKPNSRIIKGTPVSPGSYPWIGALVYKGYTKLTQFCGASVISGKWMLTAAHCVQPFPFKNQFRLRVLLGVANLSKLRRENLHSVEKIVVHPKYDKYDVVNDIALLQMKSNVLHGGGRTSTPVRPICLPDSKVPENSAVTVAGWGLISMSGDTSTLMQDATVHTLSKERCHKFYHQKHDYSGGKRTLPTMKIIDLDGFLGSRKDMGVIPRTFVIDGIPIGNSSFYLNFEPLKRIMKVPKLTGSTICANNFHTKSDSCSGDSGGPLILNSKLGNVMQVGIVSWGKGCGDPMKAGVYTDVFEYTDWIKKISGIESKCTATN